jgi:hypothetical protein
MPSNSLASRGHRIRRAVRRCTPWPVIVMSPLLLIPVGLAAPARADGIISHAEFAYIQAYGASAVCPVIDEYPTMAGVLGVLDGVTDDGFAADDAVDIINASVQDYCPSHWRGNAARGEKGLAA